MEHFLRPRADAPLQDDEPTRVERIAAERTRRLREEALGGGSWKLLVAPQQAPEGAEGLEGSFSNSDISMSPVAAGSNAKMSRMR